ncbi:MAG: hypothetical protein Q9162_007652 [Coniocarpon cinnabarinum]
MDTIAASCKTEKHHPEWSNTYNAVFVRWTTHNPAGLSEKDVKMASLCDEAATRPESSETTDSSHTSSDAMRATADNAAASAQGCGAPAPGPKEREAEQQFVEEIEQEAGKLGSMATIGGQPS